MDFPGKASPPGYLSHPSLSMSEQAFVRDIWEKADLKVDTTAE
jgi:hypothetical protein